MSIRGLHKELLLAALVFLCGASAGAQNNRFMLLNEEWDTYSQTSNRQVNGWYFCKNGINDESIVQRSNLHAYLTSGTTAGSGTTIATPWLSEVADTFSFRIYGSYLMGHTAQVEFGFIPDTATITNASDVCAQFIPYDTVELSVSNQWQRTTRDMHPYYAIHGTTHRFAIRLNNSYHQQLYLDEVMAWIPMEQETPSCPEHVTTGRDFWVAFIANGGNQRPQTLKICATGDTACSVTVSNPLTGWSQSASISAGGNATITLPNADAIPVNYSTIENKGFHVTATADIHLTAFFTQLASTDATSILPTHALDTQYIALDYPADPTRTGTGASVTILATQPNTTVRYIPPCIFYNDPSSVVGTPVTRTFTAAGQTLTLMNNAANVSLSGMKITSDKPIAVFQGNQMTGVPYTTPSGDFLYDQSIPVSQWGKEYALIPTIGRSVGDKVRVVADSACTISFSTGGSYTLAAGGVREFDLPAASPRILTADKPISVGLCSKGSDYGAEPGDGSLVMVPPTNRGTCHSVFSTFTTQRINSWYVAVATTQPATMTLDGNSIASQFQPIGSTGYSYACISLSSGVHSLDNSNGTFVGWTYGVGNVESYIYSLEHAIDVHITETSPCPELTNKGNDFWMTFLPIESDSELRLTFATDSATNITVVGPNGTFMTSLPANGSETRIVGTNNDINTINTPFPGCYHIMSDHGIWLYANNDMDGTYKSGETATILPTFALDTVYIAQDYPPYTTDRAVSFVATQDNTVLTMVLPCPLRGTSLLAGDTFTVTLQSGQAYLINSDSPSVGFSGMRVVSNGKPFAMFHGGLTTRVPVNAVDGGDLTFEQAISPKDWGTDFIVPGFSYQGGNSYIRITAAEDNTRLTIDGTLVGSVLNARECYEYIIPHTGQCHISANKPVSVILYMSSYREAGNIGDPASVTIPPLDRGVCKAMFRADNIGSTNSHYLTVICPTDIDGSLQLDGVNLSSNATVFGNYTIHRLPISQGHHCLENSEGPFVAFVYGIGSWKGYAYPLGYAFNAHPSPESHILHDTLSFADSVCQGQPYLLPAEIVCGGITYFPPFMGLIYLSPAATAETGILERWSNWVEDSIVHHIHLTLTVLPTYSTDLQMSLTPGDTVFFQGDTLTEACYRSYLFQSVYGCDSLVNLTLNYAEVSLSSSIQGGCPGEEVTLTAEGTHIFNWSSSPYDAELDSQQGQNPITVHPTVTTTYNLLDASGNIISSVTIEVAPPPTLCLETNRDFIDFDHPVLTFHDCSPDRYHSTWTFSDGYVLHGERARRQFYPPLPDTITLTLHSCNQYDCCSDTTIGFSPKIRSIWFPNIFTPNEPQNNRFGWATSCQAVEFEIFIYNRWGLLVWHGTDIDTPWDGTHDGTPVPQGAYAYKWYLKDIHGDRWSGTGIVTLLR